MRVGVGLGGLKWILCAKQCDYSLQNSVARPTRGAHVKSWTLELKPRVHTIKLYRN